MGRFISAAVVSIASTFMTSATIAAPITFEGQTLFYEYLLIVPGFTGVVESSSVVVGPGVELPNATLGLAIDISSAAITFDYSNTTPSFFSTIDFNGPVFTDQFGTISDIVGATLDMGVTNMAGLNNSRVSFTADSVSINWQGLSFNTSTLVKVDVQFVPEPSSVLLLGLGLAVLAGPGREFARRAGSSPYAPCSTGQTKKAGGCGGATAPASID